MKKYNLEIGYLGESIAKEYLEKKGYIIIDQNYKNKYAEIDLIACPPADRIQHKDNLVFVEVKTRTGEQFGIPEDAINRDKLRRLIRNAQVYMMKKNYDLPRGLPRGKTGMDFRIDAVCIVLDENKQVKRIEHYENISA